MHILFLADSFYPEKTASARRAIDHLRHWVSQEVKVTVITGVPNYHEGGVLAGYRNKWLQRESIDGIEVIRVKTFIAKDYKPVYRFLDYSSYMIMSFAVGVFVRRVDVVMGTSPQFLTLISAYLIALLRGKPFICEIRDIWPESISSLQVINKPGMLRVLEKIELFLYRRAAKIIVVTAAFKENITQRGIPEDKIQVVYNAVDLNGFYPRAKNQTKLLELGLMNKFVYGFFGNVGLSYSWDTVLEAAGHLRNLPDIVILIAGNGIKRQYLIEEISKRNLKNIICLPAQAAEAVPDLLSTCDAVVTCRKDVKINAETVSVRLLEALAMGLPCVLSSPAGESTAVITSAGAGICVPAENAEQTAEAMRRLYQDRGLYDACKQAAFQAAARFDRKKEALKLMSILKDLAENK